MAARHNTGGAGSNVPGAWAARAPDLARWAWDRLINRTDCWGGYRPPEEWGKEYRRRDGTTGKLGQQTTHKCRLKPATLEAHFRGDSRSAVVGLHSTSPENTSRWGFLDIDWHGPGSTAPIVNWEAALHWHGRLALASLRPLLLDSNGRGGFHLGFLLREPVPTPRVYHFLRRLTLDHSTLGMSAPPEQFPKQPALAGGVRFGNWLRLPGRHHSRDHWSRVWDGRRWLQGREAVDLLLGLTGDPPELLPDEAPPAAVPAALPGRFRTRIRGTGENLAARVAAYQARLPNLSEGQGRDDVAYHFAAWLVRDLALDDAIALTWLERWDAGNRPPKGRERLAEILANARRYGHSPVGCALPPAPAGLIRPTGRPGHLVIAFTVEVR